MEIELSGYQTLNLEKGIMSKWLERTNLMVKNDINITAIHHSLYVFLAKYIKFLFEAVRFQSH